MKNKLLIVCAFFCLSSCEGFLDLSPESQPNAKEFYVTEHYCPVKILDLEINRVDHHPLGR